MILVGVTVKLAQVKFCEICFILNEPMTLLHVLTPDQSIGKSDYSKAGT